LNDGGKNEESTGERNKLERAEQQGEGKEGQQEKREATESARGNSLLRTSPSIALLSRLQRKKITPTPVAAAQVDSTFLLAQPSEQTDRSFGRPAKSVEVDLRLLLKEKRGRHKGSYITASPQSEPSQDKAKEGSTTRDGAQIGNPWSQGQQEKNLGALEGRFGGRQSTAVLQRQTTEGRPTATRGGAQIDNKWSKGRQQKNLSALEGRLGGSESVAWGLEKLSRGAVLGGSKEPPNSQTSDHSPAWSPEGKAGPLLTTEDALFRTPTSEPPSERPASLPARRQLFRATSPGAASPLRLPEKPPQLPRELRRAAEARGECLKARSVSSLLRELQLIVDLLTADQTACGGGHGPGGEGNETRGGRTNEESSVRLESASDLATPEKLRDATGVGMPAGAANRETALLGDRMKRGSIEQSSGKDGLQLEGIPAPFRGATSEGTETCNEQSDVRLPSPLQAPRKEEETVSKEETAVVNECGDSVQGAGLTPSLGAKATNGEEAGGPPGVSGVPSTRGVLAFCCGDMAAAYACAVLEKSLPLVLHCKWDFQD
jgi:hypothetical protein